MSKLIQKFLKSDFDKQISIAVCGDSAIDQYFITKINKINPEAPVPMLHSEKESPTYVSPGCAANTANALKFFNVKVNLISFVDAEAKKILDNHGIDTSLCVEIPTKIPRKKRFYVDDFLTYRWDVESNKYGLTFNELKKYSDILYENLTKNKFDAIIYSDYDKGVFDNLPSIDCNHKCTVVDPKNSFEKWNGCTIFKPNKIEALNLSGLFTISNAAQEFTKIAKNVVITDGNKEITVCEQKTFQIHKIGEEVKTPPKSVIGSGDVITAFLAMAYTRGFNILESTEIAWNAGTRYVQNMFNKPLCPVDLIKTKIVDSEQLKTLTGKLVFTNGCFDYGLTKGHINCLRFAKDQGDILIVALNSDASIKRIKGESRPIMNYAERSYIMAALEFVDYVVEFEEDTPLEIIKKIMPSIIVKGGDYKPKDVVGNEYAKVIICPFDYDSSSTTSKIKKINERN